MSTPNNYQKIKVPRFYCDYGSFIQRKGFNHSDKMFGNYESNKEIVFINTSNFEVSEINEEISKIYKLTSLSPSTPTIFNVKNMIDKSIVIRLWTGAEENELNMVNYLGFLGHNLKTAGAKVSVYFSNDSFFEYSLGQQFLSIESESIINSCSTGMSDNFFTTELNEDGTSICNFSPSNTSFWTTDDGTTTSSSNANGDIGHENKSTYERWANSNVGKFLTILIQPNSEYTGVDYFLENITIGAISYGRFTDMPYSPDVEHSETISYEGVDRLKTIGGGDVLNVRYDGASKWTYDISNNNTIAPFSCAQHGDVFLRKGRRSWDISYSSLFDYHLQSPNLDLIGSSQSNDLYSQFILKTLNGQLPFIFESSQDTYSVTDENNYDEEGGNFVKSGDHMAQNFYIARLNDQEFTMDRVVGNIYSIQMNIIESW